MTDSDSFDRQCLYVCSIWETQELIVPRDNSKGDFIESASYFCQQRKQCCTFSNFVQHNPWNIWLAQWKCHTKITKSLREKKHIAKKAGKSRHFWLKKCYALYPMYVRTIHHAPCTIHYALWTLRYLSPSSFMFSSFLLMSTTMMLSNTSPWLLNLVLKETGSPIFKSAFCMCTLPVLGEGVGV